MTDPLVEAAETLVQEARAARLRAERVVEQLMDDLHADLDTTEAPEVSCDDAG